MLTQDVVNGVIEAGGVFPGSVAFKMHDTFGFPIDLTELMASEVGLSVDTDEYDRLMEIARARARHNREDDPIIEIIDDFGWRVAMLDEESTRFVGYKEMTHNTEIRDVIKGDELTTSSSEILESERGILLLRESPFYAEKGGQVGDRGQIRSRTGEFVVERTYERAGHILHYGTCVSGKLESLDPEECPEAYGGCTAVVDAKVRQPTMQNHTATHLLNWALRDVLGAHVQQKGSLVDPEKTRFDFSHNKPLARQEIERIEAGVARQIEADPRCSRKRYRRRTG